MGTYRKKPVEVEAFQLEYFNPENSIDIQHFIRLGENTYEVSQDGIVIKTLEGDMKANIGDYIIEGVKGEFYPCKPDIFELTYEKVN